MRILLSAYACEPGAGSESGVGWRWAVELARLGHNVTVVTRAAKKEKILSTPEATHLKNLRFEFFEPPRVFSWGTWRRVWPFSVGHRAYWYIWEHIYHFAWQYGAFRAMQKLHSQDPFEIVHHITYGSGRRGTFMGKLRGVRFIHGPLGGGERSPYKMRSLLPWYGKLAEIVRDLSIFAARINPFVRNAFKCADVIYVKTPDSLSLIPVKYRQKAKVRLEIGVSGGESLPDNMSAKDSANDVFRVLFVGRFLYWKGMIYGIYAFAKLVAHNPNARLMMIGDGPEHQHWSNLVKQLGIEQFVEWIPWVDHNKLINYYRASDIFLFPSLHDSSGNVVLESLVYGLPVVCLDIGGPATIVDEACAKICSTKEKTSNAVIDSLFASLTELSERKQELRSMKSAAIERSEQFIWSKIAEDLYIDATM